MADGAPTLEPMTPQEPKNANCPPLTPITPFHLNFQPVHTPETENQQRKRRTSEHTTPLLQQPLSPDDSTPVLKTRPTVEAKLVQTPAPRVSNQENRPPPSVSAKRGVLVQPKTPKTPKPKSLTQSVTDFEPFVFKLLGRLRYPNWRRLGMEINCLDHEELMRVFAFFLALFDEDLGYIVDKGGFSKAFAQFRMSFRKVGFHMTLTKRNFLSGNKKPVLPYLKMIVDKVIQKYGSVEKLSRSSFDYQALLQKYEQRRNETQDMNLPSTANRNKRRRKSVPGASRDEMVGQRKVKRRRKSDATGSIGMKRSSSPPSFKPASREGSRDEVAAPLPQPEAKEPQEPQQPQQPQLIDSFVVEPGQCSSSPQTSVVSAPPLPEPANVPSSATGLPDQEEDVEMKDVSQAESNDAPVASGEPCRMDVDETVHAEGDDMSATTSSPETSPVIAEATNRINELLVEKDLIIQEQVSRVEQLDGELKQKLTEIEELAAEKTRVVNALQAAEQNLAEEREHTTNLLGRLKALEQEKLDREAEKQELWEKITKTTDQYQTTLQQKETVINDLMSECSRLKLELSQNQQAMSQMQEQHQQELEAFSASARRADEKEAATEPRGPDVTVVVGIDFAKHVRNGSLSSLRVVDLQKFLKANGSDPKGRKSVLLKRVQELFSS